MIDVVHVSVLFQIYLERLFSFCRRRRRFQSLLLLGKQFVFMSTQQSVSANAKAKPTLDEVEKRQLVDSIVSDDATPRALSSCRTRRGETQEILVAI